MLAPVLKPINFSEEGDMKLWMSNILARTILVY